MANQKSVADGQYLLRIGNEKFKVSKTKNLAPASGVCIFQWCGARWPIVDTLCLVRSSFLSQFLPLLGSSIQAFATRL